MEYFISNEKKESIAYKVAKEQFVDPISTPKAIDPWRYQPTQEDIEYVRKYREGLLNREGKSQTGFMAVVATFPERLHFAMSQQYGSDWYDKPGILTEFLRKNPQYRVGVPMDGLAGLGAIEAKGE